MPNRILKESICSSDTIDGLSWFEEVFFYRLIVNCDDFGRFDARPAVLKARLFPLKERITLKDVSSALTKLADIGIVRLYECDSKPYLYLPTWEVHQTVRAKKSKFPAPDESANAHEIICKQMQADAPVFVFENRESNPNPNTESESNLSVSNETDCRTDFRRVMEAWNALGLAKVSRITNGSDRQKQLNRRLKDYGIDEVLRAIGNVGASDFLMGRTGGQRSFEATFDWFIKPNNFAKVLDGNYANRRRGGGTQSSNPFLDLLEGETYGQD